ncbi:MAG: magnesium transporter [Armatimonadota bacterium]|nr:magnesium transporter [Armatimonadota bacterium]
MTEGVRGKRRGSERASDVADAMRAAARSEVPGALKGLISGYHPIDIAFAMGELSSDERAQVFELLDSEASGVVLEEVDDEITADLAVSTDESELAEIIDAMPPDSGADAMGVLPEDVKHRILNRIPPDEAKELAALLDYGHESAGGLMTTEVMVSPPDITAQGLLQHIRRTNVTPEEALRVYVVDDHRRLLGAADLVSIINARDDQPLSKIMNPEPVRVHHDADQEEVVRLVDKYDLIAIPVVDEADRLLGAVSVDDVIDALQQEVTEDMASVAGATPDDLLSRSPWRAARSRVPWLLVALGVSLLSAAVIRLFEGTLEQAVMLAAFIPVITAMSGNSGLQSSMVAVRSMALGLIDDRSLGGLLIRQIPVALLVALICGMIAYGAGALLLGQAGYGLIVGAGMFCAILSGTLVGGLIPVVFRRIGMDEALASGPFVTTMNDALSLLIYFGIATGLLRVLGL